MSGVCWKRRRGRVDVGLQFSGEVLPSKQRLNIMTANDAALAQAFIYRTETIARMTDVYENFGKWRANCMFASESGERWETRSAAALTGNVLCLVLEVTFLK